MNEREISARTLEILRTYRRLSQRRLAELSGINKATISAYERGHMAIGSDRLAALLAGLGLSTRAWETTLRHVRWLDYLAEKSTTLEPSSSEELDLFTEGIGRDLERAAMDLLKLLGIRSREESRG